MRKIYVASSWRCPYQPATVSVLRAEGHEVYDFRNPKPGDHGFKWSEIDPDWQDWSPSGYRDALVHPVAEAGYRNDKDAMDWADTCVLVLPCGRSAHLEAGYMAGQGKLVVPFILDPVEPELMYKLLGPIALSWNELAHALEMPVLEGAS